MKQLLRHIICHLIDTDLWKYRRSPQGSHLGFYIFSHPTQFSCLQACAQAVSEMKPTYGLVNSKTFLQHALLLGWVHTAPLTNLSAFVDICQPFTLLCFCTKIKVELFVFVGSHCSQQRRERISVSAVLILSRHTIYCVRRKFPVM